MNEQQSKSNKEKPNLSIFSLPLNVKDIEKSYALYKKSGFRSIDGAIVQNGLTLKIVNSKIGLFQGMFSDNIWTFCPNDARTLQKELQAQEISIKFSSGMDSEKRSASFSISDPNGNLILIKQH